MTTMPATATPHEKTAVLLNVPVGCGSLAELTARSLWAVAGQVPRLSFACANPHSLVVAQEDPEFLRALRATDLVVADGIGITLVGGLLRLDVGPRITGDDFFHGVLEALASRGKGRVFFFGSTPAVLARMADRFRAEYPALTLCGTLSPPFGEWGPEENQRMVETINAARPDVLWVGMTAPKQEKWVHNNFGRLTAPVIGSIGAVFDFYAGTNPRAPEWMRRAGLEWLYRLLREPRRMWRRSFVSGPRFLGKVIARHFFFKG